VEAWVDGAKEGTGPSTPIGTLEAMNQVSIGGLNNSTLEPSVPTLIRRVMVYSKYQKDMDKKTT
jgi:hypothetical protein